jgi:hypothetical protein
VSGIIIAAISIATTGLIAFAVLCVGIRRDDIAFDVARPGLAARLARHVTGLRPLPPFDQVSASQPKHRVKNRRGRQPWCVVPAIAAVSRLTATVDSWDARCEAFDTSWEAGQ